MLEIWLKCETNPDSRRRFQPQTLKAVPDKLRLHFFSISLIFLFNNAVWKLFVFRVVNEAYRFHPRKRFHIPLNCLHFAVYIFFSLGTQLSISIVFVTPLACTDNLKIIHECVQKAIYILMSPLCNLKSLVILAVIIEWVSEISETSFCR